METMTNKINTNLRDKGVEDIVKFNLYMFMMRLVGDDIYTKVFNGTGTRRDTDKILDNPHFYVF